MRSWWRWETFEHRTGSAEGVRCRVVRVKSTVDCGAISGGEGWEQVFSKVVGVGVGNCISTVSPGHCKLQPGCGCPRPPEEGKLEIRSPDFLCRKITVTVPWELTMAGVGWVPLHPEEALFGGGGVEGASERVPQGMRTWPIFRFLCCAALELFA